MVRSALRAAVLAGALLLPSAAMAADAPLRAVNFAQGGGGQVAIDAYAVSPDAHEALLWGSQVHDLVTSTTTWVPTPASYGLSWLGASDDTTRVLYSSGAAMDPADTNGGNWDIYVFDRKTEKTYLANRGADGIAMNSFGQSWILSGDGKAVLLRDKRSGEILRVTVETGAVAVLGKGTLVTPSYKRASTDRAGTVAVTTTGVLVGTRLVPLPAGVNVTSFVVADDGSAVAFFQGTGDALRVKVLSTATGAVRDVALPLWVKRQAPRLFDLSVDGSKVLMGVRQSRPDGVARLTLGGLDIATGAITQVGGDLPYPASGSIDYVTPNWDFAVLGGSVAQLGSVPIPGDDTPPPTPEPLPAASYMGFLPGCRATGFPWVSKRPAVWFVGSGSLPVAARAEVTVVNDATGQVQSTFTLAVNGQKQITGWGGYTLSLNITFQDGTSVTGKQKIDAYKPDGCPGISIF